MQAYLSFVKNVILACFLVFLLNDKKRFLGASCFQNYELFFIFVTETISRTDEGQPRPKYIFNKCGTNIYFFTQQRFGPKPSSNLNFFWGGQTFIFLRCINLFWCHMMPQYLDLIGSAVLARIRY